MEIKPKPTHDPVADLHMADVYMRWQLLAAEEVVGKQGLTWDFQRDIGKDLDKAEK